MKVDPTFVVPDDNLSINDGAIKPWGGPDMANWYRAMLKGVADHYDFKFNTKFKKLPKKIQQIVLFGSGKEKMHFEYVPSSGNARTSGIYESTFEGVIPHLDRRYKQTQSSGVRNWIES